jgi:hypothetical protein
MWFATDDSVVWLLFVCESGCNRSSRLTNITVTTISGIIFDLITKDLRTGNDKSGIYEIKCGTRDQFWLHIYWSNAAIDYNQGSQIYFFQEGGAGVKCGFSDELRSCDVESTDFQNLNSQNSIPTSMSVKITRRVPKLHSRL